MRKGTLQKTKGFTLIEAIVFIAISGIMMSVIFLSSKTAFMKSSSIQAEWTALESARKCMEWWIGQRRYIGYAALTIGSPTPAQCTGPTGYNVVTTIAATTWNGDATYKTVTVTVSGLGDASLSWQAGNY